MTTSSGSSDANGPTAAAGEAGERGEGGDQQRRARARRRRHIDEVFGTVLPSVTDDEREPGEHGGFSAEHYRRNRPPHHGG